MNPKNFYRGYLADDNIGDIGFRLIEEIIGLEPTTVFEFGCGTGKHLKHLRNLGIAGGGIDISMVNVGKAVFGHGLENVAYGDESYLRHQANYDCVFSVSVLDHIEDASGIIGELKRMANKAVLLAETNDQPAPFYYPHDYSGYGFKKLNYEYTGEDGAVYHIWRWDKAQFPDPLVFVKSETLTVTKSK